MIPDFIVFRHLFNLVSKEKGVSIGIHDFEVAFSLGDEIERMFAWDVRLDLNMREHDIISCAEGIVGKRFLKMKKSADCLSKPRPRFVPEPAGGFVRMR